MKREASAWRKLPTADVKELKRLVGKHGREVVAAAARDVPMPKRGRRPLPKRSPRELTELAKWLDKRKKMHEQSKPPVRAPAYAALIDRYWFEFGKQADPQRSDAFAHTTKKLWAKGRLYLKKLAARRARQVTQ